MTPMPPAREPATAEGPAGLYIHIPFCRSKCFYCSFNSCPVADPALVQAYMQALLREVVRQAAHPWCCGTRFATLYIGGGTPTIYHHDRLIELIRCCRQHFQWLPDGPKELTVEMNPDTVTPEKLAALHRAGVNRMSFGVQTFSDRLLAVLGRIHTADAARQAVCWARQAGVANISLDLMFGLPTQTEADWRQTMDTALALEPDHFSIYELTVEEETAFGRQQARGDLRLPDEDRVVAMMRTGLTRLRAAGYDRYEISNYCRPGFASRHNTLYWNNESYLGLGAGAVSCFSGVRLTNIARPSDYVDRINRQQSAYSTGECLPLEARFRESVIMGLRMTAGVSIQRLQQRFGLTPSGYYGDILTDLVKQGLLQMTSERLRFTDRGMMLANGVLARLV